MKTQMFNQSFEYYKLKQEILEDNYYSCQSCGTTDNLQIDHKRAISLGGNKLDKENLQVLCESCHKQKTVKDIQTLKKYKKLVRNGDINED